MRSKADYISIFAWVGGTLTGLAGCANCMNHASKIATGEFPLSLFNLITGGIVGWVGGAVVGGFVEQSQDKRLRELEELERAMAAEKERREAAAATAREIAAMGQLREIFNAAVGGTELQRYERVKPFIGRTFELTGEIRQIDKVEVYLERSSWGSDSIKIGYSAEHLASELLKFSTGDRARLSLKLTKVLVATEYSRNFYDFHLVKIVKAPSG